MESGVNPLSVHRVDGALEVLDPIRLDQLNDWWLHVFGRQEVHFEGRERRGHFSWAHVKPNDVTYLPAGVRLDFDFGLEVALGRLRGHIDALAADIELPAVVNAAEP